MNALFIAALCLIWGSTWMAIKINLTSFPPFYSAGLRFLLAGLVLLAVMKVKGITFPTDKKSTYPSIVFGVLNGVSYGFVYWGEQFIPSSLTAVLMASLPFFSIILAYFIIGETITVRKTMGSILGFVGVLLLFYEGLNGAGGSKLAGQLAIVAAAAINALAGVHVKKHSTINPLIAVTIQMFFASFVLLLVAVPAEYGRGISFSLSGITAFLYLSLVGSALAFYLYNLLLTRMEVSKLGYIALVTPAVATLLGAIWLGEVIQWQVAVGMLLILIGSLTINLRLPKHVAEGGQRADGRKE